MTNSSPRAANKLVSVNDGNREWNLAEPCDCAGGFPHFSDSDLVSVHVAGRLLLQVLLLTGGTAAEQRQKRWAGK